MFHDSMTGTWWMVDPLEQQRQPSESLDMVAGCPKRQEQVPPLCKAIDFWDREISYKFGYMHGVWTSERQTNRVFDVSCPFFCFVFYGHRQSHVPNTHRTRK